MSPRDEASVAVSSYSFFVEGIPVSQGSMRSPAAGVVLHASEHLVPWRDAIGYAANAAGVQCAPKDAAIALTLLFYLPRPKTVTRALPAVPPDLDKLERAVGDALEGIAYPNDAQIVRVTKSKDYSDGLRPGVQISIEELTP